MDSAGGAEAPKAPPLNPPLDGQQMTFNQKYANTRTSTFGRMMVTTNMTRNDVESAVGDIRTKDIAQIGLRRFPTWIYLRYSPPFPNSKNVHFDQG